jgi:hypothetical protein
MRKLSKSDIPKGYKYAAVDADGLAFAYKSKPVCSVNSWLCLGKNVYLGNYFDTNNWQNSLISIDDEKTK